MDYSVVLLNNIQKLYVVPANSIEYSILSNIFYTEDRTEAVSLLRNTLSKLNKRNNSSNTRADERVNSISNLIGDKKINSLLDIGAGTGDLTIAIGNKLNLPPNKIFAIDDKLQPSTSLTKINELSREIPDNSIDLAIMLVVLHHVELEERIKLLQEVERVLTIGGLLIIREHNDNKSLMFQRFIDLLHMLYYISGNEVEDPLHLMSRIETQQLLESVNLRPINYYTYTNSNPQRLYYEVYVKQGPLPILFDDVETQLILQRHIDMFNLADHTYDNYVRLLPVRIREEINKKYNINEESRIPSDISVFWEAISRILASKILKVASSNAVKNITKRDILVAISDLSY